MAPEPSYALAATRRGPRVAYEHNKCQSDRRPATDREARLVRRAAHRNPSAPDHVRRVEGPKIVAASRLSMGTS